MRTAVSLLVAALLLSGLRAAQTLDAYVVDVEGGKAVLIVSPSGESLLIDDGWPGFGGRDNARIVEAAKTAGLKQIDYLLISHYDIDHLGDVPGLVAQFPVKRIIDDGPLQAVGPGFEMEFHEKFEDVTDAHAVIINRNRAGSMIIPGDTLGVSEVTPALFAAVAANEAERTAPGVTLVDVSMVGAAGRIYLAGPAADVRRAEAVMTEVLSTIAGREH